MIDVLEQDPTPSVVTRPPDTGHCGVWTLWTLDLSTGQNFTVYLLVLSQLRIYAKWTQHRHEIKIVLKDHNRLAKTRVLKIIVPTVHPFLSHFTVRSAFRITLYLNSPLSYTVFKGEMLLPSLLATHHREHDSCDPGPAN